jgi:hypothetical protein
MREPTAKIQTRPPVCGPLAAGPRTTPTFALTALLLPEFSYLYKKTGKIRVNKVRVHVVRDLGPWFDSVVFVRMAEPAARCG